MRFLPAFLSLTIYSLASLRLTTAAPITLDKRIEALNPGVRAESGGTTSVQWVGPNGEIRLEVFHVNQFSGQLVHSRWDGNAWTNNGVQDWSENKIFAEKDGGLAAVSYDDSDSNGRLITVFYQEPSIGHIKSVSFSNDNDQWLTDTIFNDWASQTVGYARPCAAINVNITNVRTIRLFATQTTTSETSTPATRSSILQLDYPKGGDPSLKTAITAPLLPAGFGPDLAVAQRSDPASLNVDLSIFYVFQAANGGWRVGEARFRAPSWTSVTHAESALTGISGTHPPSLTGYFSPSPPSNPPSNPPSTPPSNNTPATIHLFISDRDAGIRAVEASAIDNRFSGGPLPIAAAPRQNNLQPYAQLSAVGWTRQDMEGRYGSVYAVRCLDASCSRTGVREFGEFPSGGWFVGYEGFTGGDV